ncbi:DUF4230 domain-containing protein [Campylobacter sp. VBCF_06 NA8]|uniref:DUF4230 domain-containing protein n=1 Tax=Campylobacter sp. VBCF_06 NA8 TaxID=2983822 RepID=UPI0022E9A0BE|nr:DUF4230 domain-containing protein [Campylobacter sp. VBCF_06 NA8]MDA3046935.1 DUF4230 domain-containing protein [Campylobacter sp. VBCF_06 NA8]
MENLAFILNFLIFVILVYMFLRMKKSGANAPKTEISTDITRLKSIGELSVFKIYSKEIVTRKENVADGFFGSLVSPLMTKKQIAIIFEFEIDFVYDLLSPEFSIIPRGEDKYEIKMPPCKYKYSIKDMKIYDEQNSKLLPFLLPDSLNGIFGSSFDESDKNRLIDDAKNEVKALSLKIINDLGGKIHKSATDTLETIAKSFGAKEIGFVFQDKALETIDINPSDISIASSLKSQIEEK